MTTDNYMKQPTIFRIGDFFSENEVSCSALKTGQYEMLKQNFLRVTYR